MISLHIASKRQPFTKNSKLILKCLKEKIGEPDLKSLSTEILENEADVKKIMQAFLIKKGKDTSKGFRDFLKKKKSAKQKKDDVILAE